MDSSFERNECRGSVRRNSPELGAFSTPTGKMGRVKHHRENEAGGAGWAREPACYGPSDLHSTQSPLCTTLGGQRGGFVGLVFKFQQCHLLTLWPWAINRPLCLSFLICQLGARKVSTFQGCGGRLGNAPRMVFHSPPISASCLFPFKVSRALHSLGIASFQFSELEGSGVKWDEKSLGMPDERDSCLSHQPQ